LDELKVASLTIKILILFIPGAIAAIIVDKVTVHEKWSSFEFSIHSLILGFISYATHQLFWYAVAVITYVLNLKFDLKILNFWKCLFDENIKVSFSEIFITFGFSIIVGLIVSALIQHKFLTKLANAINISTKYGDENLYSYLLNSPNVCWVCIRDKDGGFTYQGKIDFFSEKDSLREVTLRDVKVFTYDNSELCYDVPYMYFSFSKDSLKLEIPILEQGEDDEKRLAEQTCK